jgi:glycosyltransferase involved in cell wall biosynthesis
MRSLPAHSFNPMTRSPEQDSQPLVSVILDNYNYGRFLQTAIESVLTQTYLNYELIVVDDGSTDNSREIIESYGDRLIAIFQENAGQEAAFTAGLARARGEIICFLDSDDYYYPDKLVKVVAAYAAHPEWVQLTHCWTAVNGAGKTTGSSASNKLSQGDVRPLLLKWGRYASGISSSLTYRRSVLAKVMPIPRCGGGDSYLNVTVPFYGQVGCINEPLMFYRIHGNNLQARSTNIAYLLQQRQQMATYLNQVAAQFSLSARFDLRRDADYRALEAMQRGGVPFWEALSIIGLSLRESWGVGRSFKDMLIRLINRSMYVLFPQQGLLILQYGLRGYLRHRRPQPYKKTEPIS